jgi:hypothetical protein
VERLNDFTVRTRFPRRFREVVLSSVAAYGTATSDRRMLPSFIIIGGQRCGTTSLYQYLIEHPAVGAATTKEVHYFDLNYLRGIHWYRGHFPTAQAAERAWRRTGAEPITGEASPYYLLHPSVPSRVARDLPDVALIVMLRDPVGRAISHYHHEVRLGFEDRPLGAALDLEEERLAGEEERILADPGYVSLSHQHHTYQARGRYAEQLERWFSQFSRERILVVEAGRFFQRPAEGFKEVLDFLGLPRMLRTVYPLHNANTYPPVDPETRGRLREYFEPHNEQLYELLGQDFEWGS